MLFFGERFLCQTAADELTEALLAWRPGTVCAIDGDQEDAAQTLAKLMSFSLLPGLQIFRVNDSKLFHSKNISASLWNKAVLAAEAKQPQRAAKMLGDMYRLAAIPAPERQPFSAMSENQWLECFGMAKPTETGWSDALFAEIANLGGNAPADLTENYIRCFTSSIPPNNRLILTAESVDKRKKLFTFIKKHGLIVDCSVAAGGGAAAQRVQKSVLKEMMESTLKRFGKKIEAGAVDVFFERVGFHPAAVVTETEKLALYCDQRDTITLADLNRMVGRSREDALFELTDHFGRHRLDHTLTTLAHLLEAGVHPLAILATLRNYIRKLLIYRALQLKSNPAYHPGLSAKHFQENYLPALRETGEEQDMLAGHPYALYMAFATAAKFECSTLKGWLIELLEAEIRLKGSGLDERLIIEELMVTLLEGKPAGSAQLY